MGAHLDAATGLHVTAVVVAHDGERWLPSLLAALDASTVSPERIVAVDTGSTDSSRDILTAALGEAAVLQAPRKTGFGAAVQAALEVAPPADGADCWIWLLHDDCAPAADTLARLLKTAATDSSIGAVGCRVRAWPRGRRLLEVGVTITGTGHRETGLELGEYDQGQHDELRDVLSVSSAGMLVRRDVWESLGGFERRLPLFRDDVDFGWRVAKFGSRVVVAPGAVIFHAEAATRGVRRISTTSANPQRGDRRAALFVLLVNCRLRTLPFQSIRLFVGSLLRALGYLLGKLPGAAWHEVVAVLSVFGRPDRIFRARSARRSLTGGNPADVRTLLPSWWTPYANGVDAIASRFSGGFRDTASAVTSSARRLRSGRGDVAALETGPVPDEAVNLPVGAGLASGALGHPLLTVLGVLCLAALLASRGLWGDGFLQGGALLPAPDSAAHWWGLYTQSWHPVRFGSTQMASPYVAVLALAGSVLLGKAWLLMDALMLLAPVLAAVGAYVAARRLVLSKGVRVWLAGTYALLPVVAGAMTSGRVGTVAATVLLPWLVPPVDRLVQSTGRQRVRAVCAAAAVLALVSAFVPVAEAMAAVLLIVAAPWLLARRASAIPYCLLAMALSLALLLPWSWRFVSTPQLVLTEAGGADVSAGPGVDPAWQLAFGRLAATGDAPWWLTAGIAVLALLALLRSDRLTGIAGAWVVIAVSLGTATVMSRFTVELPGGQQHAFVWLGFPVIVAQAAALVAAGFAADGLTRFIASGSFGWRQPLAAVAAAVALMTPVAGVAWWMAVAPHGDLVRREAVALPAYMVDAMSTDSELRVLVVRGGADRATYDVLAGDGLRLGDDSVLPAVGSAGVTDLVTDLLAEGRASTPTRLVQRGITYVVLPRPIDAHLVAQLDAVPGLARTSTTARQLAGWQVEQPPRSLAPAPSRLQPAAPDRRWQLVGQGALWLFVLVLAAPGLHRRDGLAESS